MGGGLRNVTTCDKGEGVKKIMKFVWRNLWMAPKKLESEMWQEAELMEEVVESYVTFVGVTVSSNEDEDFNNYDEDAKLCHIQNYRVRWSNN